jgi:hypothetical protein
LGYGWALAAAGCFAAAAHVLAPAVPGLLLTAPLTLGLAQLPLERRGHGGPRTTRPRRSELRRHLDRRS